MYELIKVNDKTFYIDCPAKIGVYQVSENEVYLIDAGSDKDAGRKVRQILEKNEWTLKGILNTHSNADHIGGNAYLSRNTGCPVFTDGIEAAFTEHPILEPSFLYGGYPFKDLRHKFLMAQESETRGFDDPDYPKEVKVIPLPGHFFDMVGFRTPDDTVFLADCISSKETLDKYGISFIYDVEKHLETLDKVENMEAKFFVPAHAPAGESVKELAAYNRDKVYEAAEKIKNICADPKNFEEILKRVFDEYNMQLTFEQYVLIGSTVRSYLAWMKDKGEMQAEINENMLFWRK